MTKTIQNHSIPPIPTRHQQVYGIWMMRYLMRELVGQTMMRRYKNTRSKFGLKMLGHQKRCLLPTLFTHQSCHTIRIVPLHRPDSKGKTLKVTNNSQNSETWDLFLANFGLKTGWLFQPLWKILVSWDYWSQYMENTNMFQTIGHFIIGFTKEISKPRATWNRSIAVVQSLVCKAPQPCEGVGRRKSSARK